MTLIIDCYICGDELDEQGALIFSSPDQWDQVNKYHLCKGCWNILFIDFISKLRKGVWRDKKTGLKLVG